MATLRARRGAGRARPLPRRARLGALLLGCVAACAASPSDETPAGALRLFLDAMSRSDWDDDALEEAYRLLDSEARAGLEERARLAESLSGRRHQPWEMVPQGRFRLRFSPSRQGGMQERIDGDEALVLVTSASGERAEVPLVREEGRWRLRLEIPPARERPAPEEEAAPQAP